MKIITSKENPTYKTACKLLKRKYRDRTGKYLLEGRKPLRDALSHGVNIETLFICRGYEDNFQEFEDIGAILEPELFENLTDTENSQGIVGISNKIEYDVDDLEKLLGDNEKNILILDRLQDPGNMGTVIRTAEAADYSGVIVMPGCVDVYSPKVVRSAAGSLFRMPVIYGASCRETAQRLKDLNRRLVVTSLDTDKFYYETDLGRNTALVIGNEGQGVCEEFLELSDIKIKIPMAGAIESLNAAVAAGILMYQSYNI